MSSSVMSWNRRLLSEDSLKLNSFSYLTFLSFQKRLSEGSRLSSIFLIPLSSISSGIMSFTNDLGCPRGISTKGSCFLSFIKTVFVRRRKLTRSTKVFGELVHPLNDFLKILSISASISPSVFDENLG